eukprot:1228035-Amorphochlora_amoeboformis.AAC.1
MRKTRNAKEEKRNTTKGEKEKENLEVSGAIDKVDDVLNDGFEVVNVIMRELDIRLKVQFGDIEDFFGVAVVKVDSECRWEPLRILLAYVNLHVIIFF